MLFLKLGPSSLPIVVTQPNERHANRTASVLECMIGTEHRTSGSNKDHFSTIGNRASEIKITIKKD